MLNTIYFIYNHISNVLYIIIFLNMMEHLFLRKKRVHQLVYYMIPCMVFMLTYYYPEYMHGQTVIPYYYYFICVLSTMFIAITVFLESPIVEKLVYYMYYFTVYKCIVFFLGGFLYGKEPFMNPVLYKTLDSISTLIPLTVLFVFRKFCLKYRIHTVIAYLKKTQVALMLYCPLSLFISFQLADPSLSVPHDYYVSLSAFLLVFNIPIFYYLNAKIGENNESRIEMGKALAETAAQLSRYRYTVFIEEQARKERHELKNKYFYIQTLLKENEIEKLEKYLSDHIGELSNNESGIYTNNSMIDYIINTKLALAKKHHIKTYSEILIPEKLPINEESFCTILLNLFDNAIEASVKEKNPDIQIYLNIKNQYLVFCIKNKVSFDVLAENPKLKTSKEDSSAHGLGMKIIKHAVKNSNGIFDTSMESGYFVATVMVPIS